MTARAHIESLLRAKKLDVTLSTALPLDGAPGRAAAPDDLAPLEVAGVDAALGGGLRRGHLSEIVGARSSGRTGRRLPRASGRRVPRRAGGARRYARSLRSGVGRGVRSRSVAAAWVREAGDPVRALKAMNLVLQAGGFGLVVWDLADAPPRATRGLPFTTWFRLARVIEGSQTAALVVASEHLARSAGGATIAMEAPAGSPAAWAGERSNRARLLKGLDVRPRVMSFGAAG